MSIGETFWLPENPVIPCEYQEDDFKHPEVIGDLEYYVAGYFKDVSVLSGLVYIFWFRVI